MSDLKRLSLMSVAACAVVSSTAWAQADNYYSRDKYEAVLDRVQPEFDPEPVRLGSFLVRPAAELGVSVTDNVFSAPNDRESGVIGVAGVRASGDTTWSVHGVGFDASAYHSEYFDQGSQSYTDLMGRLRGRLDVTRDFALRGAVFIEDRAEPRYAYADGYGVDAPIEYTRAGAEIGADYRNDRIRWINTLGLTEYDYEDGRYIDTGLPFDQSFRDRTELEGRTRLSYALTPNVAVFGQASYSQWEYDREQLMDDGLLHSRDSDGYSIEGGVDFELNNLLRGDIAVGYMERKSDDSYFSDVSGLTVDGRMQWFPTQLTTVTFEAGRRVTDMGAYNSPSAIRTSGAVQVDHELRRNLILTGRVGMISYDYQQANRQDDDLLLDVSALYKMNKRMHFEAFASRLDRDASGYSYFGDMSREVNTIGLRAIFYP